MISYFNSTCRKSVQTMLILVAVAGALVIAANWHEATQQVIAWQRYLHELLATHVSRVSEAPLSHGLSLIGLSFAYGVFHAVGPGHGKMVITSYLASHRESLRRGALISLLAALMQALVAIGLVVVLYWVLSLPFGSANQYANEMTVASYLLVVVVGGFLFLSALSKQIKRFREMRRKPVQPAFSLAPSTQPGFSLSPTASPLATHAPHEHHGADCCGGKHVHVASDRESWLKSLSVTVSMGIRPCSGAIVVLIYAVLVDAFFYGVLATLAMGLGTGLSIAALAWFTQVARARLEKLLASDPETKPSLISPMLCLRMAGGLLIMAFGFSLYQAATVLAEGHPLL